MARRRAGSTGPGSVICPGGTGLKAEAAVIGHVADEQHEAEAFGLGSRQAFLDERPAEPFARLRRIDDERPEQKPALPLADTDCREADAADQPLIENRAERQRSHRGYAFAHPVGAPGKPARAEGLRRKFR